MSAESNKLELSPLFCASFLLSLVSSVPRLFYLFSDYPKQQVDETQNGLCSNSGEEFNSKGQESFTRERRICEKGKAKQFKKTLSKTKTIYENVTQNQENTSSTETSVPPLRIWGRKATKAPLNSIPHVLSYDGVCVKHRKSYFRAVSAIM